ncbi:MAG: hypothetical protein JJT77_12625 [Crocinitomicaceae bacterium]|nr:hypothetical protein [Crocinitomicaceae bacterium]
MEGPTREDLALLFLRAQEYYESAHPDFYRKHFSVDTFKSWYAHSFSNTGDFSYPWDWEGFNVPGEVAITATAGAYEIGDENKYDEVMQQIIDLCKPSGKFYLIGTMDTSPSPAKTSAIFAHEIAHALYYLDKDYRNAVDLLIAPLLPVFLPVLTRLGYHPSVRNDETQAYLVSGVEALGIPGDIEPYVKNIHPVFEAYLVKRMG